MQSFCCTWLSKNPPSPNSCIFNIHHIFKLYTLYCWGEKHFQGKKKGEKEIKFFGVISVGTYQLGMFQFLSIFLHREIKQHIKDEFWSCLPFLFFCHYICSYDFNYRYITSSMKSLRSDEFWNSEFVKITWSIYHTYVILKGAWEQYPIIK